MNTLTKAEQDKLVTDNIGLARKLAKEAGKLDPDSDRENLYGEAMLLLTQSSRKWDPANGTPFVGFAANYVRERLKGMVKDGLRQRAGASVLRNVDFSSVGRSAADPDAAEPVYGRRPDAYDTELLASLDEHSRGIVAAIAFEGCSPEQVAVRFGMSVKDVKLVVRNVAPALQRAKERLDQPDLLDFADGPAAAEAA